MMNNNKRPSRGRRAAFVPKTAPPALQLSVRKVHTFRFEASSASTTDTLSTTSLGNMLIMAASATNGYQLCNAIRLRKIEIWGPMASDLIPVTVSVDYTGQSAQAVGPSCKVTDTSMGANRPAHIVAIPPRTSTASTWQYTISGLTLCTLEFPANAVVDITLEFVLQDNGSPSTVVAISGATTGVVYLRRPDVAQLLVPVSWPTI